MTMFEKLNFMKPLVIGGAAAAAIARDARGGR